MTDEPEQTVRRLVHEREGGTPPPPEPLGHPVADAHCHLDLMDEDPLTILDTAASVGVTRVMTIGVDVESSQWCADMAKLLPHVGAAVAIHPNEAGAGNATDEALAEIDTLAALQQVRAVGETGLDRYRTEDPGGWDAQEVSLRAHAEIARRHGKPLVIHDRDAHDEVLKVLDDVATDLTVVIHAFSGDAAFARECAARGWVCSFAGNVTFKNAPALRAAVAELPRELILVETDAPFLTPMPYRGRPNAPSLIPLTLRVMAAARGEDTDELAKAVDATTTRVFGEL
jgi:TatD DNase family protein